MPEETKTESKYTWQDIVIRVETLILQAQKLGTTEPLNDARQLLEDMLNGGEVKAECVAPKPLVTRTALAANIVNALVEQFQQMEGWRQLWLDHPAPNRAEAMETFMGVVKKVLGVSTEGEKEEASA